jgi:acyl-CoA synthetase (AMP-forming)/AMP-acid ligase II/1-acyl-sn-glycerol-3-phosphate acyltransferase/acyl carrier protein
MTSATSETKPYSLDYGFGDDPPQSLPELVRRRAEISGDERFVTFLADADRDERVLTFAQLWERTKVVAGELQRRGLTPGDRILIMLPTGLGFLETFFGIQAAGMVPVPVYPPARLARLEHYLRTVASITESATCRAVILDERLVPLVGKQLTYRDQLLITDKELEAATEPGEPFPTEPGSSCFLQFTSGTTSQPKGVHLLQRQVVAQLVSYCEMLEVGVGEPCVSWLPLYHDMGLIGKVLAVLYAGAHLILISPVDFLKDPMVWLRAITRYKVKHTAAPNFSYGLVQRKCPPERLRAEGIDLSSLDSAGLGGEPASWATVESFREYAKPFGFNPDIMNACYGLAENTLAVCGHRRGELLRKAHLSRAGLEANRVEPPTGPDDERILVSNGRPAPYMEVRIVDASIDPSQEGFGAHLGEEQIGEIWATSGSLASGYIGEREKTREAFPEVDGKRWVRTGDTGFLKDGDVFVCGRSKDLMIVRGRNYHPMDVELAANSVQGVRTGNLVAFSVDKGEGEGEAAVLVAEVDPRNQKPIAELKRELKQAVVERCQLSLADVVLMPKGSIPKTSSGKLQRSIVRDAYARGELSTLEPPGRLATSLLKLRLGAKTALRKLTASRGERLESTASAVQALDPRFAEAIEAVGAQIDQTPTPSMRVDALGLDSLEQVELWLQLERRYAAKVPEERWSATATLGDLQQLLEEFEGKAQGAGGDAEEASGDTLLVRQLLRPREEAAPPAFRPPPTAPLAFGALTGLSRTFWRWRVLGQEHLARDDGFVIAGNHVTYFDGAWLRNATTPAVRKRLTAYHWSGLPAFTRMFLAQMDTIPIDPEGSFQAAIRAGVHAVEDGKVLLIFPEGMRTFSGRMRTFRPGVGLVSLLSQKPIVPFRSRGMFHIFPRDRPIPRFVGWKQGKDDRLEVRFGPAIHPPKLDPARAGEQAAELVRELRAAVERL